MTITYPIRVSQESFDIVEMASSQLEITSKKNVISLLIKAGAKSKGIKILDGSKK